MVIRTTNPCAIEAIARRAEAIARRAEALATAPAKCREDTCRRLNGRQEDNSQPKTYGEAYTSQTTNGATSSSLGEVELRFQLAELSDVRGCTHEFQVAKQLLYSVTLSVDFLRAQKMMIDYEENHDLLDIAVKMGSTTSSTRPCESIEGDQQPAEDIKLTLSQKIRQHAQAVASAADDERTSRALEVVNYQVDLETMILIKRLATAEQDGFRAPLKKHKPAFTGKLGTLKLPSYQLPVKSGVKPFQCRAYLSHMRTCRRHAQKSSASLSSAYLRLTATQSGRHPRSSSRCATSRCVSCLISDSKTRCSSGTSTRCPRLRTSYERCLDRSSSRRSTFSWATIHVCWHHIAARTRRSCCHSFGTTTIASHGNQQRAGRVPRVHGATNRRPELRLSLSKRRAHRVTDIQLAFAAPWRGTAATHLRSRRDSPRKSKFCMTEAKYLDFKNSKDRPHPVLDKVLAVAKIEPPKTRKQLRRFVSMTNYCREMWERRAHMMAPHTQLCSPKRAFK
ncbi:hypothetical protein PybrP1_001687 [[Pythium] brassicae (nom. inval.)]|nr:hypothetical protein PybrP1_001687 [[Pythium] brassicae (nom. inval.)]